MTQPFDYSDSTTPDTELIPVGEVAIVQMRIRAGSAGEDGMLTRAKDGKSEYLNAEFVLLDGKHAKMKFWQILLVTGETDGHKQMIDKSQAIRKAVLDSAYGIRPDDKSPEARAKRSKFLREFDGIRFQAKVGIEKGGPRSPGSTEMYRDKNTLAEVITPDKTGYRGPFEQSPSPNVSAAPAPSSTLPTKPDWAKG
jgi:hypothetical protein